MRLVVVMVYSFGMVVLDLISRQQPNCESNAIFPIKIANTNQSVWPHFNPSLNFNVRPLP